MANLPIKSPAEFTTEVYQVKQSDLITDNIENQIKGQLLNNDIYLKQKLEEMGLTSNQHTTDTEIHVSPEEKRKWDTAATQEATQSKAGLLASGDKKKLDNIATGAEVNQNAFSKVKAGNVLVEANSKTAQIEIVAGNHVTIKGDNASKKITIEVTLPSSMSPSAHTQSASSITAGTFPGNVSVKPGTDYTTSKLRNVRFGTSVPSSLNNGEVYLLYS